MGPALGASAESTYSGLLFLTPRRAVAHLEVQRRQRAAVAGASGARAAGGIEARAVRVALDLAGVGPQLSVADVHGLQPVGADIDIRADRSVGCAHRESLDALIDGKAHRRAGEKRRQLEQLHFAIQGISRPPARRLAARAMVNNRSERRLMYASASRETGARAASSTILRSARRQTVRQRCNAAPA